MQNKFPKITTDSVVADKALNTIVAEIEALLKPYHHSLKIEISKHNGSPQTIGISANINLSK